MNSKNIHALLWRQTSPHLLSRPILWLALAAILFSLGWFTLTTEAAVVSETMPDDAARMTVLVGPIDEVTEMLWTVAGVPVQITDATRFNERMERRDAGLWARVEAVYSAENDELVATRIKILPPHPFISIRGQIQELTTNAARVGGIPVVITPETRLLGNPAAGMRVRVIADAETYEPDIVALRIQRAGDPYDDDDDGEEHDSNKIELTGQIQERPANSIIGLWKISTISVDVNAQTEVKERVSALLPGAWVKVEGHAEGGVIIAAELKSTETRRYHKLEGTLESLDDDQIVVNGIALALAGNVEIEDNPQPGQGVEVRAQLIDDRLIVTHVEGERGDDDDDDEHSSDTRHIAGVVQSLPADGLLGEWQVGRHTILVNEATQIYEHKGLVRVGAVVRVEVLKGSQEPLTAVEVVVLRRDHDDDDDDHGNHFVEFRGTIQTLPADTLIGDWLVSDRTVVVSTQTELKGDLSKFEEGARVQVKGYRTAENTIEARQIKLQERDDDDDHHGGHHVELEGNIKSLPTQGLIGAWRVAGQAVQVTPRTEIDDEDEVAIGVKVEVKGRKNGNGPILAEEIEVDDD